MKVQPRDFLLLVIIGDSSGDARIGANDGACGCAGRCGCAQTRRIDPRFLGFVEPLSLEWFGTAAVGSRAGEEQVTPEGQGQKAGVGNGTQLVGDYTNPILQPWAAQVVKKFGEISLAGKGYPTPRNQCWPEGMPFVFLQITEWRCFNNRAKSQSFTPSIINSVRYARG